MRILFTTFIILLASLQATTAQSTGEADQVELSTAIDLALENATSTRIAEAEKNGADIGSGLLSSDYLPRVSSSLSYTKSQYPQIVTPIRQQGVFPPLDDQIYEASFQADWQIFDFGASRAARQSAKALADAAYIKYDLAKMEAIESTASNFVEIQRLKELRRVQNERIHALQKSKEQLESLYKEGRVAKVDLLKIQDAIIEAETAILATKNKISQALQQLSHDLGMENALKDDNIVPIEFESDYLFNPDKIPPEEAPHVAAARKQWNASQKESRAANRALLPQLNLYAAEQFRTGSDFEVDDQWMVGIRLNLPIFAGKKIVNSQVKKIESKEKKIRLEKTRQQYVQQLNQLTNAQFEIQKRIESTQVRLDYLEETYRVEEVSYREGRTTLTDLLSTESKLNGVRAELIAMRAQLRFVNLNMAVLTGQLNKNLAIKLAEGEAL